MTDNGIAILQFNHSDKQESSLKEIAPRVSRKGLSRMLGQFRKQTSSIAAKAAYSHFQHSISSEIPFEQQLYEAYQLLFNKGFKHVIGIANDCPSLSVKDIECAAQHLQQEKLVFGPAKDGGLYLLGISKDQFSSENFAALPWRTERLYREFTNLAESLDFDYVSLKAKADMDTVGEFRKALLGHYTFLNPLKKLIASLQIQTFQLEQAVFLEGISISTALRGPPQQA